MELSKKIILVALSITVIVTIFVNLITNVNFFGAYYVNLYVIFPIALIQVIAILLFKKAKRFILILNILIAFIMLFILYKLIVNN